MARGDKRGRDNSGFRQTKHGGEFVLGRTNHNKDPEGMVVVG